MIETPHLEMHAWQMVIAAGRQKSQKKYEKSHTNTKGRTRKRVLPFFNYTVRSYISCGSHTLDALMPIVTMADEQTEKRKNQTARTEDGN